MTPAAKKRKETHSERRSVNNITVRLLLIEDNPDDTALLLAMLSEKGLVQFEVSCSDRLENGLKQIDKNNIDVILLDLNLPDSHGLETLVKTRDYAPEIPVIVMTGLDDELMAVKAVQSGSQDYLIKDHVDYHLLTRSIRHSIERNQLRIQLDEIRTIQENEYDSRLLDAISAPKVGITAGFQSVVSLMESQRDVFNELVSFYGTLMDNAIEQLVHQKQYDISDKLIEMAGKLGLLRVVPRDVIDIHKAALTEKTAHVTSAKKIAYIKCSRLIILELMGHLVTYYRNYAVTYINTKQKIHTGNN